MTEVFYRFRCKACFYTRDTREREDHPVRCPACGEPQSQAAYVSPTRREQVYEQRDRRH